MFELRAIREELTLRRGRLAMWPVYWMMNVRLGKEVDEKFNVPIGRHLDELPK